MATYPNPLDLPLFSMFGTTSGTGFELEWGSDVVGFTYGDADLS